MVNKIVNWACETCEQDNVVEIEEEPTRIKVKERELFCVNCGVANIPQPLKGLINRPNGQWLPCLELTGWEARIPNGKTPNGYRDGKGNLLSRDDYKKEHHIDPKTCWRWLKAGRPTGKSQEPTTPLPMPQPKPPEPIVEKDEAAKLKEEEESGRLGRVEYLSKLMALLKVGKIVKGYYEQEVDRVLNEM